jgi:four helix bundle protein
MRLAENVYRLTATFPAAERFGLIAQLRRAAVSVPSNIAEGAARGQPIDGARFMTIAIGSMSEPDTQIRLAQNLNFCSGCEEMLEKIDSLISLVSALRRRLREKAEK